MMVRSQGLERVTNSLELDRRRPAELVRFTPRKLTELLHRRVQSALVESKMGAVAWGQWPALRFPSPLIEPDLRSYRIRLSDWLHRKAHSGAGRGRRSRHSTPRS